MFSLFFFLMTHPPPTSTLFPYTTLFRSPVLKIFIDVYGAVIDALKPLFEVIGPLLGALAPILGALATVDRKSTRLNSSHVKISYAVFCLKKKNARFGYNNNLACRSAHTF